MPATKSNVPVHRPLMSLVGPAIRESVECSARLRLDAKLVHLSDDEGRKLDFTLTMLESALKFKDKRSVCIIDAGCFTTDYKGKAAIRKKIVEVKAKQKKLRAGAAQKAKDESARMIALADSIDSGEHIPIPGMFGQRESLAYDDWGLFDRPCEMIVTSNGPVSIRYRLREEGEWFTALIIGATTEDLIQVERVSFPPNPEKLYRLKGVYRVVSAGAFGKVNVIKECTEEELAEEVRKARIKK